jgi:hypothetical protein
VSPRYRQEIHLHEQMEDATSGAWRRVQRSQCNAQTCLPNGFAEHFWPLKALKLH